MFRTGLLEQINPAVLEEFFVHVEDMARPLLFQESAWMVDYVRLRMTAIKK